MSTESTPTDTATAPDSGEESRSLIDQFNNPPIIDVGHPKQYRINLNAPIHQLAMKRMADERDLKIIITAEDSETGVGKTTLAGWFALSWTWMFAGQLWTADQHATLNPNQYFRIITEVDSGTVVIIDDAEELDARRSMQDMNVKFSWWWMIMRLQQVITILTLPSPASIDSRIEELADVWINVKRRGEAMVHDIRVQSYGARNVMTEQVHRYEWPNIAEHEQLQALSQMKSEKMDKWQKQATNELSDDDDNDELGETQQTFLAVAIKEREGVAWRKVPDQDDRLTYSGEYYRQEAEELVS